MNIEQKNSSNLVFRHYNRQIGTSSAATTTQEKAYALRKLPSLLTQYTEKIVECNKIFASKWISNDTILFGTKDNKLISWNINSTRCVTIPRPQVSPLPTYCAGIHFIQANKKQTQLATGSTNPLNAVILSTPYLLPAIVLVGHTDWIFNCQYISNNILVTASRDSTLKVWNVTLPQSITPDKPEVKNPLISRKEHSQKIRDLCFNEQSNILSTLSADGTVKIWDVDNLDVIGSIEMPEKKELVCMQNHENRQLLVVGSQSKITVVDTRCNQIANIIDSNDGDYGVRCLQQMDDIISVGGGEGRLSFLDLRMNDWIPCKSLNFVQTNKALWQVDHVETFSNLNVTNAIYTHDWHSSGTKIFVGGGPLMMGFNGSYAALYQ